MVGHRANARPAAAASSSETYKLTRDDHCIFCLNGMKTSHKAKPYLKILLDIAPDREIGRQMIRRYMERIDTERKKLKVLWTEKSDQICRTWQQISNDQRINIL